jgi:hypothetical protein
MCSAMACAAGPPSLVRDIDGNPLPPYAFSTGEGPVLKVRCTDGNSYFVVTNPPPFMLGMQHGTVVRLRQRDASGVCDRILASRL